MFEYYGVADTVYLAVPCLGGIALLAAALYTMARTRKWWFAIPAIFGASTAFCLLSMWIIPEIGEALPNLTVCPGVIGFLLLGAVFYFVMARDFWKKKGPTPAGQPPTPPADPPPASPK